jgi:aspartyl protease family protein
MKMHGLVPICISMPSSISPEPSQRRTGGLMIVLCWVVIITLVSVLFSGLLDDQHNPNAKVSSDLLDGGDVQVKLRQNAQGHYLATGTLNGAPAVFLLDTGATTVSVPARLARALRLQQGRAVQSQTANGSVRTYQTRIDEVSLGGIVMRDVPASINPGMQGNEVLLGMSFLRHLDLHQQGRTLTLTQRQ